MDKIEEALTCEVKGSDATVDCVRGTPCKHVKQDLASLIAEERKTAERKGELHQLKMLQHWQNLHGNLITPSDLQHMIRSLEQFPDQPLSSQTLIALKKGTHE